MFYILKSNRYVCNLIICIKNITFMKKLFFLFLVTSLFVGSSANAQEFVGANVKNSIYSHTASLLLFNMTDIVYERNIAQIKNTDINISAGAGVFSSYFFGPDLLLHFPVAAHAVFNTASAHHTEVALGMQNLVEMKKATDIYVPAPLAYVGYRYQKPAGGFLFKIGVNTFLVSMSLGYSF